MENRKRGEVSYPTVNGECKDIIELPWTWTLNEPLDKRQAGRKKNALRRLREKKLICFWTGPLTFYTVHCCRRKLKLMTTAAWPAASDIRQFPEWHGNAAAIEYSGYRPDMTDCG